MENVIYPNSIHLRTMLGNCDVVTPLTYPDYNIDYPSEIYPYRSALWQKFLVESLDDSSIVRYMWEDYGIKYADGNAVSLFPIYNTAIEKVTDNNFSLSDAYADYAIWRYFTGSRSIPNEYFNESFSYCSASTENNFENSFTLSTNKGSSRFINLPSENLDLLITTDYPDDINFIHLKINQNNDIYFDNLSQNNSFSTISDDTNILIANANYSNYEESINVIFNVSESNSIIGDANNDGSIDVLDIIYIVNLILFDEFEVSCDINNDSQLNIVDIIILVNIIIES